METQAPAHARQRGFTLVEVMVAMVIGMIGLIIMMQVFSSAEGQRRATTGTGDAQSNGAMGLYALQRDIRQSGQGFNALNAFGCALVLGAPSNVTLSQLAPVVINPPTAEIPLGDANTDRLLIVYGNTEGSPEGDVITAVNVNQLAVQAPTNFQFGQWVMAAPAAPTTGCSLTLATVAAVAPPNITVLNSGADPAGGGTLFNLGTNLRVLAYAIRGGNLTVCDYLAANCSLAGNYVPIANNIVSLRAQYGRDTSVPGPGRIDTWDQNALQPAPATPDARACLWARASAVRIAIVARNSQVDQGVLTAAAPTWEGSTVVVGPPANPAALPIVLTAVPLPGSQTWQNFRYKVFETVVPIRNLAWMATCTL